MKRYDIFYVDSKTYYECFPKDQVAHRFEALAALGIAKVSGLFKKNYIVDGGIIAFEPSIRSEYMMVRNDWAEK